MKVTKKTLGLLTITIVFMVGCTNTKQTITEKSLGLRTTDLYSESEKTVGDRTSYINKAAGESQVFQRAFENAPPMIPHNVDGMLPITIDNNSCTGCHTPGVAESLNATPIPKSHFTDFRPDTALNINGKITKEGRIVDNTSDFKIIGKSKSKLVGGRYNCSACHSPQSMGTNIPVPSVFKADFRTKNADTRSNLVDNINEGVDTIR